MISETEFLKIYKDGFNPLNYITPDVAALIVKLRNKTFHLRDTGISSASYNQWKKNGLIDSPILVDRREWVTLSMTDMIWLKILDDLRKFGCSLDTIRKVKRLCYEDVVSTISETISEDDFGTIVFEAIKKAQPFNDKIIEQVKEQLKKKDFSLYKFIKQEAGLAYPMLEAVLGNIITTRSEAYIIVFLSDYVPSKANGTATNKVLVKERHKRKSTTEVLFFTEEIQKTSLEVDLNQLYSTPHIKIPLKNYLADFILEIKNQAYVEDFQLLSKAELVLLKEMRKGSVSRITIHYSKDKIERIDVTRPVQKKEETRLVETFLRNEFADIEYTIEKGQIVKFQKTTKIKPSQA